MTDTPTPPLDYVDAHGTLWAMAACGHRCGGGVTRGERIALCPNCCLRAQLGEKVHVVYPERLPLSLTEEKA